MSRPPHAYVRVLDAAERVLIERSAAAFTLDAVAAQAQVSKGGLMYHFRSKEELLTALVTRAVTAVDDALAAAAAGSEPGVFTRAYLDITIPGTPAPKDGPAGPEHEQAGPEQEGPEQEQEQAGPGAGVDLGAPGPATAALVAAVALDPRLLTPLRDAYARWQDRLEHDGIDPAAATVVRLAVDGWWLAALLGLPPLAADVHGRTRELLERLAGPVTPRV